MSILSFHTHIAGYPQADGTQPCSRCGVNLLENASDMHDPIHHVQSWCAGRPVVRIETEHAGIRCYAAGNNNRQPKCEFRRGVDPI